MLQALDDILDSAVLITGTNSNSFGTGFAIYSKQGTTWILTCAHVVEDVGGAGNIRVNKKPAEVVAFGKPKGVDLAVLSVQGLDILPLKLMAGDGRKDMACGIAGFAEFAGSQRKGELLEGTLGSRVVLTESGDLRVTAWKLWIEGKTPLESGYSGSPVMYTVARTVFAVASHSEYQGERGYAVSLAHLKDVWPELPSGLVSSQLQTGDWLAREQREFLENLFQKLPVSDEKLRAWCYQAMPPDEPHEIPADANSLDLLEWLVERGRLARGQVPLLSMLCKFLPSITDADARNSLKQCIKQTAGYFGITDIHPMPKPAPVQIDESLALMLEIWPSASPGNRCNVQGRLFYASDRIFNICVREKETVLNLNDDEDRTNLVEELREQLRRHGVKEKEVIVEFILPRELLFQAVEQWTNEAEEPLGRLSPVVVRPMQRLREPALQMGWQDCWDYLLNSQNKTLLHSLWPFDRSQWRQVRGKLEEGKCIALRFVPDVLAPLRQHDLHYLLSIGTPVALWPRQEDGLADFVQELQAFLANKPLKDLPEIIRAMRQELWENEKENTSCYHLTLLWDDPNRRLPDKPENDEEFLQAPV